METTVPNDIKALTDALRELADFVDQHPEFAGALQHQRFLMPVETADEFHQLARSLGGKRQKDANSTYFGITRTFGDDYGIQIHVYTERENVCEAVKVGTEKVEVPDPNGPKVVIERDVIEWKCSPVLAEVSA